MRGATALRFTALFWMSQASSAPIICPERYSVSVAPISQVDEAPSGWVAHFHGNLPLLGATVLFGPPQELRENIPEFRNKGGGVTEEIISEMDSDPIQDKWVSCSYGDPNSVSSRVTLARRLPAGIKRCISRYRKTKSRNVFLGIECE